MWGAGYPEAEQRTLTSMPWEKRCDLVWMGLDHCGVGLRLKPGLWA